MRIAARNAASHLLAARALPTEHEPEHVVRLGRLRLLGTRTRAPAGARRWPHPSRAAAAPATGTFSPASSCPRPFSSFPARRKTTAEIDVGGRHRRRQRHRALQARAGTGEIAGLAERHAEKRVPARRPGIEPHALAQLGDRLLSRAAVPQGRAEVVPCLGRFGTKDRGPLQVRKRGGQVALLAEDVSLQRVRLRMIGIQLEGLGQRVFRRLEIAAVRPPPSRARRPRLPGSMRGGAGFRAVAPCCFNAAPSA